MVNLDEAIEVVKAAEYVLVPGDLALAIARLADIARMNPNQQTVRWLYDALKEAGLA